MTTETNLTNLTNTLASSYDAVEQKGGVIPNSKNFENLAGAINSIPSNDFIIGGSDGTDRYILEGTATAPFTTFIYRAVGTTGTATKGELVDFCNPGDWIKLSEYLNTRKKAACQNGFFSMHSLQLSFTNFQPSCCYV